MIDGRFPQGFLLPRASVVNAENLYRNNATGVSWTAGTAEGSAVISWQADAVSASGFWTELTAAASNRKVTVLGWFTGPAGTVARVGVEHVNGATIQGQTVALDPVTPTVAQAVVDTGPDIPRVRFYASPSATGQAFTLRKIGVFVGVVPAAFWRLPPV